MQVYMPIWQVLSMPSGVFLDHLLDVLRVVRLDLKRVGAGSEPRCTQRSCHKEQCRCPGCAPSVQAAAAGPREDLSKRDWSALTAPAPKHVD